VKKKSKKGKKKKHIAKVGECEPTPTSSQKSFDLAAPSTVANSPQPSPVQKSPQSKTAMTYVTDITEDEEINQLVIDHINAQKASVTRIEAIAEEVDEEEKSDSVVNLSHMTSNSSIGTCSNMTDTKVAIVGYSDTSSDIGSIKTRGNGVMQRLLQTSVTDRSGRSSARISDGSTTQVKKLNLSGLGKKHQSSYGDSSDVYVLSGSGGSETGGFYSTRSGDSNKIK
jgi:hypothetical protein